MKHYYVSFVLVILICFVNFQCHAFNKANTTLNTITIQESEIPKSLNTAAIPDFQANQKISQPTTFNNFSTGFYYGILLMSTLISIVCFFLFQEKLYILFAAIQVAIGLMLFANESAAFLDAALTTSVALFSVSCLFIAFTTKFLEIESKNTLRVIINSITVAASLFLLSYLITGNELSLNVSNILLFSVLVVLLGLGISKFTTNGYSKLYVVSNAIPLLLLADFFILKPISFNFLNTELMHLKIAFLAQMFLMSYTILYRMKSIKEANEIRKIEMKLFIKNQEAMSRKNIELMMEDLYLENLIMNHDLNGMDIKLLQYISEGKENSKIARKLKLSENDLQEAIKELYQKLGVESQIKEDNDLIDSQPDYIYN